MSTIPQSTIPQSKVTFQEWWQFCKFFKNLSYCRYIKCKV